MLTNFSIIGEYFAMAWAALRVNKLRSILTTLGILISVTTIITIFTTIQGMNEYVMGELAIVGSSTVYIEKYPWANRDDFWKYRNRKNITIKEFDALIEYATIPDYISPTVFSFKTVKYRNEVYEQVPIIGTNDQFKDTDNVIPATGRFLTGLDIDRNHYVCILGDDVANKLFKNESPMGKRIKVGGEKYRVVGINEKRGKVFGRSMDNYVLVPYGTFRRVMGGHRGMRISLTVKDVSELDNMKEEARGILRRVRKVSPEKEDDFALNQQDMLVDLYRSLTGTLFAIVFVIGGISLVVGGIGITNIMLVSVSERTKEIGIRKAIGAKRKNILSQFIIESIAIASIGGVIGIGLGYLGGSLVLAQMELTTGVSITSIVIGFGFSAFTGIAAGFYPAWKAARMNPIDSLHFE